MKVLIITQDDTFYLYRTIGDLVDRLREKHEIVGAVVLAPTPFGKREGFIAKALRTLKTFGFRFFAFYSTLFILHKIRRVSVSKALKKRDVNVIKISGSINTADNVNLIKDTGAELLISVTANQVFKRRLFDDFQFGCINLHTALLPKYRGLMPTFWVLKNDETYTGVSVFQVDDGIDSGPIICQERVIIGKKSQRELIRLTKSIGVRLLTEAVDQLEKGLVEYRKNSDRHATYFGSPTKADVKEFYAKGKRFF